MERSHILLTFDTTNQPIPPGSLIQTCELQLEAALGDSSQFNGRFSFLRKDGIWNQLSAENPSVRAQDYYDFRLRVRDTGATTLDEIAPGSTDVGFGLFQIPTLPEECGQAFVADSTGSLGDVLVSIQRRGLIAGNVFVEIREPEEQDGSDDAFTSTVLATSDPIVFNDLSNLKTEVLFTFSGAEQVTLNSGQRYVAVLIQDFTPTETQHVLMYGRLGSTPAEIDPTVKPSMSGAMTMFSVPQYGPARAYPKPYFSDGATEQDFPAGDFEHIQTRPMPVTVADTRSFIPGLERALQGYVNSEGYQPGDPLGLVLDPGDSESSDQRRYKANSAATIDFPTRLTVSFAPPRVYRH